MRHLNIAATLLALVCMLGIPNVNGVGKPSAGPPRSLVSTPQDCKRLLWFTALHVPFKKHERFLENVMAYADQREPHETYAAVALLSALKYAPSVVPVLVNSGSPSVISAWWEAMGGVVVHHWLSFYQNFAQARGLGGDSGVDNRQGAYLRIDAPAIIAELRERLNNDSSIDWDYMLYTDADVQFRQDVDSCALPKPKLLLMGGQLQRIAGRTPMEYNSGVMYFNVSAWPPALERLVAHGDSVSWKLSVEDQTLLNDVLHDKAEWLPDEFNWKAYWGAGEGQALYILHWHGPKPRSVNPCVECWIHFPPEIREEHCRQEYNCYGFGTYESLEPTRTFHFFKSMVQEWLVLHYQARSMMRNFPPFDAARGVSMAV